MNRFRYYTYTSAYITGYNFCQYDYRIRRYRESGRKFFFGFYPQFKQPRYLISREYELHQQVFDFRVQTNLLSFYRA